MALCRSHLFSQMVGSVAGITYFFNRYGSIVARNRSIPVDPMTAPQMTIRARMAASMAAWQGMTQAQRDAWTIFANGTPWVNSLGDECRLAGVNMYLSIRMAALQIDPTIITSQFDLPPCIPGLLQRPEVILSPCTSGILEIGFKITAFNDHPTDSIRLGIQISLPQNTTINFWAGPYSPALYAFTPVIPPEFATSIDILRLISGKRYFLRYRSLDASNENLVSSPWHGSFIAAGCTS